MVTTTFKQQATIKVVLPKSNQPKTGATPTEQQVIVAVPKNGPLSFKGDPVTFEKLQQRLKEAAADTNLILNISADTDAPWGLVLKVWDAANMAHFKGLRISVDSEHGK